eukprot:3671334-Lingulodinium_polyedra.AAC.1
MGSLALPCALGLRLCVFVVCGVLRSCGDVGLLALLRALSLRSPVAARAHGASHCPNTAGAIVCTRACIMEVILAIPDAAS